jgi:hypothetical protein
VTAAVPKPTPVDPAAREGVLAAVDAAGDELIRLVADSVLEREPDLERRPNVFTYRGGKLAVDRQAALGG